MNMFEPEDMSGEVLNAMHILIAAMEREKPENGNTSLHIDYKEGLLIYENHSAGWKYTANIAGDSESGAIMDCARQIILKMRG